MSSAAAQQIEALREMGYKINVKQLRQATVGYAAFGMFTRHELRDRRKTDDRIQFSPRGGCTRVTITAEDGTIYEGEARCRQDDPNRSTPGDTFSYRLGLTIALNRALKKMNGR